MSFTFNGTTSRIIVAGTGLADSTNFSIFGWAKMVDATPSIPNSLACMTSLGGNASLYLAAQVLGTTGNIRNLLASSGTVATDAANNFVDNTWGAFCIRYTLNGSNQITELDSWVWDGSTETYSTPLTGQTKARPSAGELIIGARTSGTSDTMTAYFTGKLSNVAMYNKKLLDSELTELRTKAPLLVAEANLIGYWPLTANSNAYTGYGNNPSSVLDSVLADPADDPTLDYTGAILKLKLLAHPSAAGATGIAGMVCHASAGIAGSKIGEFTGAAFEAGLESGQAVLKVATSEFDIGQVLDVSDTPVVLVRNATNTTGLIPCTVIEE